MTRDAEARGGLRASASRPPISRRTARRRQRGAVTAEAMVVLPVVVVVTLGLVWVIGLAAAQVRVVDGAREAARAAARGEGDAAAAVAARRVAPPGARLELRRSGGVVTAVVTVRVTGPGALFRVVPGVTLTSRAAAAEEPR